MPTQKTNNKREIRSFDFTMETRDGEESPSLKGHAGVFNQEAVIGGWFREKIDPGAFNDSIKEDDVRALFNHDPNIVLGRNTAGTLKLEEDKTGLAVDIDPPDTQAANDLRISIKRGDINQMSFGFNVLEDEWVYGEDGELDLRTLKKIRLFDVSPVTFPAYEGTDIALRSHNEWIESQEKTKNGGSVVELKRRKLNLYKLKGEQHVKID